MSKKNNQQNNLKNFISTNEKRRGTLQVKEQQTDSSCLPEQESPDRTTM